MQYVAVNPVVLVSPVIWKNISKHLYYFTIIRRGYCFEYAVNFEICINWMPLSFLSGMEQVKGNIGFSKFCDGKTC